MNDQFRAKLAIYGQWTYRAAWGLEITAALIGLATGIALGYQAFASSETATTTDLTLASAPFFYGCPSRADKNTGCHADVLGEVALETDSRSIPGLNRWDHV